MAYRPNCGSSHIQLKRETNVNWGRAVAGWTLLGIVGGAVGAVTGEDRNVNACLDCGTTWKAADLYKTLEIIKSLTQEKLNLSLEADRLYMNNFISEIGPYLDSVSKAEKEADNILKALEAKQGAVAASGCMFGCLTSILLACGAISAGSSGNFIISSIVILTLIGWGMGALIDKVNKKPIEIEIKKMQKEAEKLRRDAELSFKYRMNDFMARHLR